MVYYFRRIGKNQIIQDAKTEIAIEISSDVESSLLAKDFWEKIAQQFGTLVLCNEEYNMSVLKKMIKT